MIRLVLLLLGADVIRRQSKLLTVVGIACVVAGVAIIVDALDGRTLISPGHFGYFLLADGILSIPVAFAATNLTRRLRIIKATVLIVVATTVLLLPWHGNFLLALTFGFAYACDGGLRVASALIVRFQTWRSALALGIVQLLFAVFMVEPWPTRYAGTIAYNVGLALTLTGISVLLTAHRLRRLPADVPLATLLHREFPRIAVPPQEAHPAGEEMILYVWTPSRSAGTVTAQRPLLDRYVAAVDANGVISTGHVALEGPDGLYISHYPAHELDRSREDFARMLRATHENDVPGRFLPSYEAEAAQWCPATARIRFSHFDAARLAAFWSAYQQDTTYNLTNRNCTSVVARALDVALEGSFGRRKATWQIIRLFLSPELWVAAQMRRRAETMAWTPGLMFDYARALRFIVEAPPARRIIKWRRLRTGPLHNTWRVRQ